MALDPFIVCLLVSVFLLPATAVGYGAAKESQSNQGLKGWLPMLW